MGFIEVITGSYDQYFGLRKDTSAEDLRYGGSGGEHAWGMVECSASQIIEGHIAHLDIDFFLVGYAEGPAAPPPTAPASGSMAAKMMATGVI